MTARALVLPLLVLASALQPATRPVAASVVGMTPWRAVLLLVGALYAVCVAVGALVRRAEKEVGV